MKWVTWTLTPMICGIPGTSAHPMHHRRIRDWVIAPICICALISLIGYGRYNEGQWPFERKEVTEQKCYPDPRPTLSVKDSMSQLQRLVAKREVQILTLQPILTFKVTPGTRLDCLVQINVKRLNRMQLDQRSFEGFANVYASRLVRGARGIRKVDREDKRAIATGITVLSPAAQTLLFRHLDRELISPAARQEAKDRAMLPGFDDAVTEAIEMLKSDQAVQLEMVQVDEWLKKYGWKTLAGRREDVLRSPEGAETQDEGV